MFFLILSLCIFLINGESINKFQASFPNFTLNANITSYDGYNFTSLIGFGLIDGEEKSTYYAIDWSESRVIIFNEKWKYKSYKYFKNPANMIRHEDSIFITAQYSLFKTDKKLNIIQQYNCSEGTNPSYRGIMFNSKNSTLYVVAYESRLIYEFTLDFEVIDSFATPKHYPWSIQEYDNKIFVGTYSGYILVIVNKIIVNTFNACNGCYNSMVTSMIFDKKGFIYVTSSSLNSIYLYNNNGSYTGISMKTPNYPQFTGYDSKGRFIIIAKFQISIYNT
jgi:hypothetical protein